MNIASYTKRLARYAVDFVFASLFPAGALIYIFYYAHSLIEIPPLFLGIIIVASEWIVFTLINTIWMYVSNGRTLGNLIFGTRVVKPDISRLTFGECLTRNISEGLIFMIVISWVYMLAIGSEKSVFDRMTNTVIVDWRNRTI